jgi:hypothetical protein
MHTETRLFQERRSETPDLDPEKSAIIPKGLSAVEEVVRKSTPCSDPSTVRQELLRRRNPSGE